jgi:hypothetical protein
MIGEVSSSKSNEGHPFFCSYSHLVLLAVCRIRFSFRSSRRSPLRTEYDRMSSFSAAMAVTAKTMRTRIGRRVLNLNMLPSGGEEGLGQDGEI